MRSDIHCSGLPLCARCWTASPRGYNAWSRAASALAIRLDLPRAWRESGIRQSWLEEAANRYGITAWCDVDTRTTLVPSTAFGWLDAAAVEAAAVELTAREAQFNASRLDSTGAHRP